MSYFDNSTICCPLNSSPATYHSYMCKSKGEYANLDNERLLKTVDYDQLWSVSQEQCTIHSKTTHHISKLRNILSETISHITKDSKLLKGESVELTLEIELMKTENHTPSNSMVEVTIIQHNKKGEGTKNKKPVSVNPEKTVTSSITSESASQKRRNWFQRVISRQIDQKPNNPSKPTKQVTDSLSKNIGSSAFHLDQKLVHNNNVKSTNQHPRSNFINVLPEKIPISNDFKKGYRRVSPEKKTPRAPMEFRSSQVEKTVETKKKSAVKKLSEIFLPTKKSNKNKAVRTALTALKNEVDNIKLKTAKENEGDNKPKRAPVHNLGKLVGNILDDMMDTPLNNASNNEIQNQSLPLKYQNFFEPVSKSNIKRTELNNHKKRTTIVTRNVVQSHSDTCCLHYKYDSSGLNIKTSNSVSDWRAQTDSTNPFKSTEKGDSTEITSTKKYKDEKKNYKKSYKKHAKGDATTQFVNNKVAKKRSHKNSKTIGTKKSIIEWNGQTVQVNKEIKTKIEMLIVNELQNLALKEGMECDVIPLHWSESCNDPPVEKMSSFICELDISDKKTKKHTKSKQSSETKPDSYQKPSRLLKKDQPTSKLKQTHKVPRNKDLGTSVLQPLKKDTHIISFGENLKEPLTIGSDLTLSKGTNDGDIMSWEKGDCNNDVKITYVNMNVKNWSTESNTLKFQSPDTFIPTRHDSKVECGESPIFKFGEENYFYQKAISSGFIKRIDSNDTTWKNGWLEATEKECLAKNLSKQLVTVTNTKSNVRFSSATSNEYQSSIEIELDIKDLELVLKEAKQKQKADKILVNAKCKRENNKKQRNIRFTGKNSPSYTNQLLTSAAEILEKYIRRKSKQRNNDKIK